MIVADVNLIAYLTIQSEHSALAEAAYARDSAWAAPLLWSSEFRNTLAACVRHRAMTVESALLSLRSAEEIIGEREYAVASENVLRLAGKRNAPLTTANTRRWRPIWTCRW